jgi:alpha-L-rhamnosidase
VEAFSLKTEHLVDPIGIDPPDGRPRLSWWLRADGRGAVQTAYQVRVASDAAALARGEADVWDSGKVASGTSDGVAYGGPPLAAAKRYAWTVRVWDGDDLPSGWAAPAHFEMGLTNPVDWGGAAWVGRAAFGSVQLRRAFTVPRPVARARAYVAAVGCGELYLNGRKVGDRVLEPATTLYHKTVLYSVYDVTDAVAEGDNVVGVVLGHAWGACPRVAPKRGIGWFLHGWHGSPAHGFPKALVRLRLDHDDGSITTVVSDGQWRLAPSPTVDDCHFYGDTYDARRETPGWASPGFDDAAWSAADEVDAPGGRLRPQVMPPMRVVETIRAERVTSPAPGVHVFHFPRNVAGWTRLRVAGPAGTVVKLQHSERLAPDGTGRIDTRWFAGDTVGLDGEAKSFQTNAYVLKGGGAEEWEPRFTYHGFQFVEVRGFPGTPTLDSVEARVVHNDLRSVGTFDCSNPLLNTIHDLTRKSILSNAHGFLTDTPVYEKAPWLGDALLTGVTTLYNFDVAAFYDKWFRDMAEQVRADGHLGPQAPKGEGGQAGDPLTRWGADWEGALLQMPWEAALFTGDDRPLIEHYDALKRHTDYELGRFVEGVNASFWGDWLAPDGVKPIPGLCGTAYACRVVWLMADVARRFGRDGDAAHYAAEAARVATDFNARFFDAARGLYRVPGDDAYYQTANLLPLAFGLVPAGRAGDVNAGLIAHVDRLQTGIHGTRYLCPLLTDAGAGDAAFKIATATDYPSWGHWIEHGGATALFEVWERDGNRSRNHHMFGSIDEWFFSHLAGLRPAAPGFRAIEVEPHPVGDLTRARATLETPHGPAESSWHRGPGVLRLDVTVPPNTTADVLVPADADGHVSEGDHRPASLAPGVSLVGVEGDRVRYRVGSGRYGFTVDPSAGGR